METVSAYPQNWNLYHEIYIFEIREILNSGIHPNIQNVSGVTLFHEAVNTPFDNIEVVKELINAGEDINCRSHLDFTPLHHAVFYGKRGVFDELIQSGADVNAQDFRGRSILHLAVSTRVFQARSHSFKLEPDTYVIEKLLQHKNIDCNLRDENGDTPLMIAVKDYQMEVVYMLLENNVNPNVCNNNFETALHMAFSGKLNYIEMFLLLEGSNIGIKNKDGETAFDYLIKMGLDTRPDDWIKIMMKIIGFKYFVTTDIKRKLECIPNLSEFFLLCCEEGEHMRCDFISGNLTVQDFILDCFNGNDFKNILLEIHKPLVDRLSRDVYSVYFIEIFDLIPKCSLYVILQMTVFSRKQKETKGDRKTILDLFSNTEIAEFISIYLGNIEIFHLIVAFSDVEDTHSKRCFYECHMFDF